MASFCMPRWSLQQDELISPAWRACSPFSITVLSCHGHLLDTPLEISNGGVLPSISQTRPDPYRDHDPYTTQMLSRTLVQVLASGLSSGTAGEPGASSRDGNAMGVILDGRKRSASNSWSSPSLRRGPYPNILKSLETIWVSSRDGGRGAAETGQQTSCSDESKWLLRALTPHASHAMFPANPTLQTAHQEDDTLPRIYFSPQSQSPPSWPSSSRILMQNQPEENS
ncbi:hypothetical protein BOTBODRAFT_125099, partial [Botryobasidium botryosum FD-172 SS1]